jgi:Bacterial Ig-like domain
MHKGRCLDAQRETLRDRGGLRLVPDGRLDLESNSTYKVVVVGGSSWIKDVNGNALAQNKSWTFTTAGATTSLTVLSTVPAPASTDISTSTNVTATFSKDGNTSTDMFDESINANTFWLTFQVDPDHPLLAQVTYDPVTKTATLHPDGGLQPGTSYTATIKGGSDGVKDTQGESLAQNFSWTFMTASAECVIIC